MRGRSHPTKIVLFSALAALAACDLPNLTDEDWGGSIEFAMTGVDMITFVGRAAFTISYPPNEREAEFWTVHVKETVTATGGSTGVGSRGRTPGVGTYPMGPRTATEVFVFWFKRRTPDYEDSYQTVSGEFIIEQSYSHRIVGSFTLDVVRYCRRPLTTEVQPQGSCDLFNPAPEDPHLHVVGTFNMPQVRFCCFEVINEAGDPSQR